MENTSDSTIFGSDRGWNDPPPRLDTASATTGSSGARLNKRVGFPSSFTSQSSDVKTDQTPLCDAGAKSLTGITPPPPVMPPLSLHANISSPSNQLATNKEEAKDQSDVVIEVKYQDVGDILESCLCEAEISGGLDEKKASDIRKRIGIFKEKWTSDKLNNKVHQGMLKLAQLMENGQIDEAEKIQRNLNVEFPNLCTPWMIAVRQLILSRNKSKNL